MIWHNSTADDILQELNTDMKTGLSSQEAAVRLKKYGKNEFHTPLQKNVFSYIKDELCSFISITLLIVALVFGVLTFALDMNGWVDALMIGVAVIVTGLIKALGGYFSSVRLFALRNDINSLSIVIRDGEEKKIPSNELVVGDILVLKAGDYIRADGRVLEAYVLTCDELRITGDTVPSEKLPGEIYPDITPLAKRANMIYAGSVVVNGRGLAVVTETSNATELGSRENISKQISPELSSTEEKLETLRKICLKICVPAIAIVFFAGIIAEFFVTDISFAITVTKYLLLSMCLAFVWATSIIPVVRNFSLAFSVQRMKKHGILIKEPKTAELLKDITVICTDKTGALTTGNMSVAKIYNTKKSIDLKDRNCDDASAAILRLALICSNFSHEEHTERHSNNMERAIEDACALYSGMNKIDIDGMFPRLAELPFDSERMLMTTVTAINGKPVAIIKGAPEIVLDRCIDAQEDAHKIAQEYAKEGLKVIAIAVKHLDEIPANPNSDELEFDLSFTGIIGFEDCIDKETSFLINNCKACGIKTVMVTGDHLETAVAIGLKLGIITDESQAISGEQLEYIDDETLAKQIADYCVFARVRPQDKLRIVSVLKAKGENVAVTGDSINDTPALLASDIGCALGKTASDMVKDSAKVVISDDRFSTLITAIKESGRVLNNIKKALCFLLFTNLSLIATVLFGLIFFGDSPLGASSIMYINLLCVCLPMLALFADSSRNPRKIQPVNKVFNKAFMLKLAIPSVITITTTLIAYTTQFWLGRDVALSSSFCVFSLSLIVHAFCISHTRTVISPRIIKSVSIIAASLISLIFVIVFTTSSAGLLLAIDTPSSEGWIIALVSCAAILAADETLKIISPKFFNQI